MSGVELRPEVLLAIDQGGSLRRMQLFEVCAEEDGSSRHQELTESVRDDDCLDFQEAIPRIVAWASEQLPPDPLTGRPRIDAVGLAVAGEVTDGVISRAGKLTERGWLGQPAQETMAQALGLEDVQRVRVINDTFAVASSQRWFNLARDKDSEQKGYVYFHSTGVGGAAFDREGVYPDEPGHQILGGHAPTEAQPVCSCGSTEGHVEAYLGADAILQRFGRSFDKLLPSQWTALNKDIAQSLAELITRHRAAGFVIDTLYFNGRVTRKPQFQSGLLARLIGLQSTHRGFHIPKIEPHATEDFKAELMGARIIAQEYLDSIRE
jgi:predicted NBD/HSP70 family sugar kinase